MVLVTSQETSRPRRLILASTSPYRKVLLERLGIPFECRRPEVDENAWKQRGLSPQALAESLAAAKAGAIRLTSAELADVVVIGSDQVCARGAEILDKPGTESRAVEQLEQMAGGSHQLLTAVCIRHSDRQWCHTDIATLRMRPLTRDEITRYVAADMPLDCAGSYKLEQRGIALFDRIDSADYTAIVGLPLIYLTTVLRELGFAVP